jgi:hypothetical protein
MNLGDPEAQHDAVNLKFLDRFLKHDGSSQMTGTLNLGGYSITNVAQPVSAGDLVTKGYADNVVGSTHLDMRGHKIVNLREPTARSDAVTKGFVESIFNTDLDMREHKIRNVADPVGRQDVVTVSFAEAHYLKQGSEIDMKSQRIRNLAEPSHLQDAATLNYVNSVLARKKLASQLFVFSRTTTSFELNLSDTAGPTLKFVFTYITQADENARRLTYKATHIVSANEPEDPINRKEFINLVAYSRQHEPYNISFSINKFLPTSNIIIIEPNEASKLVSLKVDVFRSLA